MNTRYNCDVRRAHASSTRMNHSFSHSRDMTIARPDEWMRVPSRTCASSKARVRCPRRRRGTKVGSCVLHTQSTEHEQHGVGPSFASTEVPIVLPMFPFGRAVRSSNNYCFETSASSSRKYGQGGNARNLFESFFHNNQSAEIFLANNIPFQPFQCA